MNRDSPFYWHILLLVVIVSALAVLIMIGNKMFTESLRSPTAEAIKHKLALESKGLEDLHFDLVDPGEAPEPLRALVRQGFHLMTQTQVYAPDYVGDKMSCSNCHFGGGNTTGGDKSGISLAGVAAKYPNYMSREQKVLALSDRINLCFVNSMHGKPLPVESQEMLALITYLHWISKDFPIYRIAPWLGLKPLSVSQIQDPERGKALYEEKCASCHGMNGAGENTTPPIPPVWGQESFTVEAGMSDLKTLSSFIYWNMPYNDPSLTMEEAWDVAAYLTEQERPGHTKTVSGRFRDNL
jgi:thiosulfate dehydrogenase